MVCKNQNWLFYLSHLPRITDKMQITFIIFKSLTVSISIYEYTRYTCYFNMPDRNLISLYGRSPSKAVYVQMTTVTRDR